MPLGQSFFPGGEGDPNKPKGPQDRYQQAIQVLSMRLPKILGGGALAPAPLLESLGGQGQPFGRGALPQQQMNPMNQAFAQMAGIGPGASTPQLPRVVPGVDLPAVGGGPQVPTQREAQPPAPFTPLPQNLIQGGPNLPLPENATPFWMTRKGSPWVTDRNFQ